MNQKRSSPVEVLIQLFIIFICVYIAYKFTQTHDIIPKSIIRLPDIYISENDIWHLSIIFTTIFAIVLIPSQLILGRGVFYKPQRFASEYMAYLCAYTTASLYIFFVTTINYHPQLIAATGLFSTIAYVLVFVGWYAIKETDRSKFSSLYLVPYSILRKLFSVKGILILIYFLSPLLLGKAFVSDRDTANLITQIRIWFNPVEDSGWGLKRLYANVDLSQPMLVRQAPNDPKNLYILERNGRIIKLNYPESDQVDLVLDATGLLGEVEMENGALGFDFHPEFNQPDSQNAGFLYLYYTESRGDTQVNKLSRFDVSSPDINARLRSETTILSLPRNPDGFHNGGSIEFGPDGFLYIGLGEGVHPKGASNYSETLRSGILRIDLNTDNTHTSYSPREPFIHGIRQNYLIPQDNPFVENSEVMDEYWAIGLRNPFRFTFDPETKKLWAGDVGSTVWEEVNIIEKGKHYQFPFIEGRHSTGKEKPEKLPAPEQGPVYTYEHTAYDRAVIGGTVYRGNKFPELFGKYVFADNYSAKIFLLNTDKREVTEAKLIAQGSQYAQRGISSVVQLNNGDILVTLLGAASHPTGEVLSLVKSDQKIIQQADHTTDNQVIESETREYDENLTRQLFSINCSRCHGREGRGDGPDAELLDVKLPDFTSEDFQSTRTDNEIRDVIAKGGAPLQKSPMMPPWGGFLKQSEIDHLTIYTRNLGKANEHHTH
ncbi:hypothetical protein ABO04_01880 [Nitrosomonas sp. HPC101]|uniref:PQQ-dependent sugar dehydrogenase n=1 Tax=Nitrosomonas sp. HPC101 TaxID=1658667 RepID=UPI00136E27F5|nr:PQQ-dependent sugar dehydrogenase [Nitrosomonas sp. HPC101]MXS84692.1 hypothetical protein [Nitrosomonas sp. HPC101]